MNVRSPGQVEQRTALAAPAPKVDGRRLHGPDPLRHREREISAVHRVIERGALAGADLSDLIATREHDRSKLLGRHPTTLSVEDRSDGFAWSVELPDSPVGEDCRVACVRGDLRATSWRMIVGRDEWRGNVRHVHEIAALHDVTVTAAPSYGDAAPAEYRSTPEPEPDPPAAPATEPETTEATMPEGTTPAGGLVVEDRSADDHERSIEERVVDAVRSIHKGESRSLTTANASELTPPDMSTFVWDRLRPASIALASGVRVITTERSEVIWPRIVSDVDPTWLGELDPIPAGDPAFGTLTASPKKLAHRIELSNEVLDDSEPPIVDVLNLHLLAMLGLKLDRSIFEGNPATNANSIRGLKYTPGIQVLSMGTNGAALTNYDPLIAAVGMLRAANVAGPYAVAAGPGVLTALELLKDADDSNAQLGAPAGLPPFFSSTQLSTNETQGTSTTASSAYVYAPAELVLVRRQDAVVELDRSRLFDVDASELRGKLRCDLIVPNPAAVVRITGINPAA